jgi:hypothetical protein
MFKAIKLFNKLSERQEKLFDECVAHSQSLSRVVYPGLSEYRAVNNAVRKVRKKVPRIYFLLLFINNNIFVPLINSITHI